MPAERAVNRQTDPVTTLRAAHVVTPRGVLAPGEVEIDGGVIRDVRPAAGDVTFHLLGPGLIDLQVNGVGSIDVWEADHDDWDRMAGALLDHGVTAWCPTLVSRPLDEYRAALDRLARAARRSDGPEIVGVHLEGPFLAPRRRGAHRPDALAPIDLDWLRALPDVVRIVTLAPELDRGIEAVRLLAARGTLVGLGHSEASFETALEAIDAGARLVTHLYNGMEPLHHRRPGLVGAALSDHRVTISLIADLVHVHPGALRLAFETKGIEGAVLVSDAVAAGVASLAGPVEARDGAPRLADGTLAGSTLTLDRAVANAVACGAVGVERALAAAASAPAALLGLGDRGRIEPGCRADLVALTPSNRVEGVWVAGDRRR